MSGWGSFSTPKPELRARRFVLDRIEDISGVSGTGIVADGVVFPNGKAVIGWRSESPSVIVYDDMVAVSDVHGHGGATRIVWVDP